MTSETIALTPHQVLAAARLLIFERAPFFRAGVLQMVPREAPDLGTFATTKDWIMLWDPAKAVEYGTEGTAAVIVHELWHLLRDHFGRFSEPLINQDLANIAGDLSINPGVRDMGFKLPTGANEGLWPSKFELPENLSAEEYYAALQKMNVRYAYLDNGCQEGKKFPSMTVLVEGCGSCSGRKRQGEPEGDAAGRSEAEIQRTRVIIAKAIQQSRRGNIPADLDRWAGEVLAPARVRWQEKLARISRAAVAYRPGAGHSTYAKVARRQAGVGFGPGRPILPAYRATTPRVTLLVDTSGSMNQAMLTSIMSEAQGILVACGAQLDMMVCDAEVHGAKRVKSIKEACAMLRGGGGSDFRPAFEEISKKRPKCSVVVAATDGDITVPAHAPPGLQVIWLLVAGYGGYRKPCDWGAVIEIEGGSG